MGLKSSIRSFNQIGYGGEDKWPSYSRSSCPWGHTVWPRFRGDHTMKMCHFLLLAKWLSLWTEKNSAAGDVVSLTGRELNKEEHCLPVSSNRKNIAWSELNRKLVTLKEKNLRLSWKTFLWISLTWTHPDCTETRTHLCSCSTIKSTSELRPTQTERERENK